MIKSWMGRAAYVALPGLVLFAFVVGGCGNKADDTAATNAKPVSTTTAVPANAPPVAQESIRSAQAQGAEMQRRGAAMSAAMKAGK